MNIISVFNEEEKLIEALHKFEEKNLKATEIFSPYPIHEVLHYMGKKSRLSIAAWLYGLIGGTAVLSFLYYTSVISWPLNYGGKPFNSFPSFIVITLILVILIVTISSLATFSARSKLYPGKKDVLVDRRATDDKFVVVFNESISDNLPDYETYFKELGADEVYTKEHEIQS